uniref:non-specific serine/threonine protein kinase n=1 Tax=Maylandia zebra TaxID=106582 RepID=A0A3P9AUE2_9CICH
MPPKAKAAGRGRAPAKRKLAEEFPPGEVLKDTMKKEWKLGAPIGQGALGSYTWVRKTMLFEPIDNGPLFCELAFYMRAAKPDLIQSWMKSKKLKNLGVPRYWGSGRHERGGQRYRFMVIDRLGTDLQKKFEECGRRFPRKLVLQLGLRLLDTLEYIHEHEYVHADVKASNLMLSHSDPNQVYLVDYGLAYRYAPEGLPKEYKEDPKKCHDGTIEFTSIDCHKGGGAGPSKTTKRKMAADRAEESEVDSSPVKKKRVTKKNDRPKKSPQKTLKSRKVPSSDPKSRLVEMGTQTSPGLAQKSRGRPKKTST